MIVILDVAIGLSFVFLLFSLFTTALNEIILSFFDQRASFLREGLNQILGNHEETLKRFISHGLIDSFSREKDGKPAYLPPDAFVNALLDLINPVAINDTTPTLVRTAEDFAAAVNRATHPLLNTNPKLRTTLKVLFDDAGGDLDKFKKSLENWFNESMDRVSGWYKRRAQNVLFGLSLAGALACNVDAIHLIQGLSSDQKLREGVVTAATDTVRKNVGSADTSVSADLIAKQVQDTLAQLDGLSLPIGWNDTQWNYLFNDIRQSGKDTSTKATTPAATPATAPAATPGVAVVRGWNYSHILSAFVGWFVTALAASLGGPFWFETLTRFINIRGNGLKPEDSTKIRAAAAAKIAAVGATGSSPTTGA